MWKQKDKLLAKYEDGQSNSCRNIGMKEKPWISTRLSFIWFKEKRVKGPLLAGPILKEKALQLALSLGLNNFKASDGWFTKWEKFFNVAFKKSMAKKQQWTNQQLSSGNEKNFLTFLKHFPHLTSTVLMKQDFI
ncbi:unnamed protein product [Eretmochelys imbricata]